MRTLVLAVGASVAIAACAGSGQSAGGTHSSSAQTSAAQPSVATADTAGDPNTPCSVIFTLARGTLGLSVTTTETGDLVVEPYVNGTGDNGQYRRQALDNQAAGVVDMSFANVTSVDQIPTVLYPSADSNSAHVCSVVRKGDPAP